jgi:hypothetical protein
MKIEYDDLTESDLLVFARNISEQHKSKIRKLTPRSASLLWSTYCYPGRFDFRAHCHDGNEAMLISRTAFDELDEEPTMNQIAPWLCSIVDAVETESVHLLRAEWGIDGFELPWEVFLATWYWLLPFLPEGHAVLPSKNVVVEFCAGDCSVYRLSLSEAAGLLPDDLNERT